MKEISLNILDIVENSTKAKAEMIAITIVENESSINITISDNGEVIVEKDAAQHSNSVTEIENGTIKKTSVEQEIKEDEVVYSEKMHYDLLVETQGVSLERISSENMSSDKNNWHSAASNVNYGTPGYKNSMNYDYTDISNDKEINVIPEIFSPDGDGFDDICNIHYNLDDITYTMNIKIFNSKGIFVKVLLDNSLV